MLVQAAAVGLVVVTSVIYIYTYHRQDAACKEQQGNYQQTIHLRGLFIREVNPKPTETCYVNKRFTFTHDQFTLQATQ